MLASPVLSLRPLRTSLALFFGTVLSAAAAAQFPLSGRILDADRKPVRDAEVELVPRLDPAAESAAELLGETPRGTVRARTGEDGRYRLVVPGPGLYRLRVAPAGLAPMEESLRLVEERTLDDQVLRRGGAARVEVVDAAGRPVEGARVRLRATARDALRYVGWSFPGLAPQRGRTDAAGRLDLLRPADVALELAASAPGLAPAWLRLEPRDLPRVTLGAAEPRVVAVRFGTRPVPGAAIRRAKDGFPLAVTDETGSATVDAPRAESLALEILASEGRRARALLEPWRGEEPPPPFAVTLEAGRRIEGRVVDLHSRRPIRDALVTTRWIGHEVAVLTDGRGQYRLEVPPGAVASLVGVAAGHLETHLGPPAPETGPGPTLALPPALAVRGQAVDAAGRPVAAAEIVATSVPAQGLARPMFRSAGRDLRALSDAQGRFLLTGLDPALPLRLEGRREGFAPATARLEPPPAGGRMEARLQFEAGARLSGRVVSLDGTPIAGARLGLVDAGARRSPMSGFTRWGAPPRPEAAVADEEGRFGFGDLGAGPFDLEVAASGFAPTTVPGIRLDREPGPLDLGEIVLDPGVELAGRVLDGRGRPAAGAEVQAHPAGRRRFVPPWSRAVEPDSDVPRVVADELGDFVIPDRRAGERLTLEATLTGSGRGHLAEVLLPTAEPVTVRLQPIGRVSGRVLDERGGGVAEATVFAVHSIEETTASGGGSARMSLPPTTADADGGFELDELPAGKLDLTARASDGAVGELLGVELAPGAELGELEIRLEAGARGVVTGTVVEPGGAPAVGAMVQVVGAGDSRSAMGGVLTDGDGRFRVERLAAGRKVVNAHAPPYRPEVRQIELAEGQEVDVWIELAGGGSVSGRVLDEADQPVAEARLQLSPAGGRARFGPGQAASGADGSFRIEQVQPGSYLLRAEHEAYAAAELTQPITVEDLEVAGIVLRMERGAAIEGELRGVAFDELASVRIVAHSGSATRVGAPDYESRFRLDGIGPGEWTVTGRVGESGRQARAQTTVAAGAGSVWVELEFGSGLVVAGQVRLEREPVAAAAVSAQGLDVVSSAQTRGDHEGRFRLEGLVPGRHRIRASDATGLAWAEVELDLDADRQVDLDLASARIQGTVRDARDGSPLARVRVESVRVTESPERPGPLFRRPAETNSAGRFSIPGQLPGELLVRASREGFASAEQRARVIGETDVVELEFLLEPNEGSRIRVVRADGAPARGLRAVAVDERGTTRWSESVVVDDAGIARLTSLPPGSWRLLVAEGDSPTVGLTIDSPGEGEVLVPEPGALRLRVPALEGGESLAMARLLGPDGAPYRSISFWATTEEFPVVRGRATLPSLPPGDWTVEVRGPDGHRFTAPARVVARAETEVLVE